MTQLIGSDSNASSASVDPFAQHFATEHLVGDLKNRSVRGGAITVFAQATKFGIHMVSTVVLARLLAPSDFGLIAMVLAIIGFVAMFKDAGLSMATVQRAEVNHAQVSTLFWINVALSVLVMAVVMAMAPLIVWFYGEPKLLWITVALSFTFIVSGLTVQHQALLKRQMRFKDLAAIEVVSMAIGVAVAITMAGVGFGFWALVGLPAGTIVANCAMVWMLCRWRPGPPVRGCGVGSMLRFGWNLTAFSFVNHFSRNMDNILIGWWWGAGPLGLYSKAYALLKMPVAQINAPVSSVVIPALSRLQDEPARYRRYYIRAIGLVATVGMPICAFAFAAAEPLVPLVLGQQWAEMVPIFRALAPAALAGTLNIANGWVFVSLGRADRQLRWGLVMAVVTVSAFVAGLPWGPMGVAVAYSAVFVASRWPGFVYCFRGTPIRTADVWSAIWRPLSASLVAAGLSYWISESLLSGADDLVRMAAVLSIFPVAFGVTVLVTPGGRSWVKEIVLTLKELKKSKRPQRSEVAGDAQMVTNNDC